MKKFMLLIAIILFLGCTPYNQRCTNKPKGIHNLRARYNEHPIDNISKLNIGMFENTRSIIYYRTYIHDICLWCGKIIKSNE